MQAGDRRGLSCPVAVAFQPDRCFNGGGVPAYRGLCLRGAPGCLAAPCAVSGDLLSGAVSGGGGVYRSVAVRCSAAVYCVSADGDFGLSEPVAQSTTTHVMESTGKNYAKLMQIFSLIPNSMQYEPNDQIGIPWDLNKIAQLLFFIALSATVVGLICARTKAKRWWTGGLGLLLSAVLLTGYFYTGICSGNGFERCQRNGRHDILWYEL